MRKFLGLLLVFVMAACQSSQNGTVNITGKVAEAIPQGEVVLEKYQMGELVSVEMTYSDHKGNFELDVPVDAAGVYRLSVYGKQAETIILDKENLKVEASGIDGEPMVVTGSKDMEHVARLQDYITEYYASVRAFNQKFIAARNANNSELVADLTEEGMALDRQKIADLKELAWSMDGSLAALLVDQFVTNKEQEFSFLDSLGRKLTADHPKSTNVKEFVNMLEIIEPVTRMGDIAPEIKLPNPDGEDMKLSDLRGKYVLLDFWAGWCRPCRAENPNVVAMYNKYNEKGFEVFSVSLDRFREQWISAIEKDGLIWPTHVSDVKYFNSQAAIDYKVNAIPYALLLDPEGRVIGKNLRGRMLRAKLESIFGE